MYQVELINLNLLDINSLTGFVQMRGLAWISLAVEDRRRSASLQTDDSLNPL